MIDPQLSYERAEPDYVDEDDSEGVCATCGGTDEPCECDENARDEAADRKFEEMRERRYGG